RVMAVYHASREDHVADFDSGIEAALGAVLVGREFLFRTERDPAGLSSKTAYHLSDLELASRLSFFLWSSIPDDALLDAAARGELSEPAVLEHQAARMLADVRSKALVINFAIRWLGLPKLRITQPDPEVFPDF